jgi:hypothetical protein
MYLSKSLTQGVALGYYISPLQGLMNKLASLPVVRATPRFTTLKPAVIFLRLVSLSLQGINPFTL